MGEVNKLGNTISTELRVPQTIDEWVEQFENEKRRAGSIVKVVREKYVSNSRKIIRYYLEEKDSPSHAIDVEFTPFGYRYIVSNPKEAPKASPTPSSTHTHGD